MARSFTIATPDFLSTDTAVISGTPLTLACWFNAASITSNNGLMFVGDKDVGDNFFAISAQGAAAGDPIRAMAAGTAFRSANSSTGYSADTWHHACGVFTDATDRSAFIDGGSKGTNAQSSSPANLDRTAIGRWMDSTPASPMGGLIAEAAVWNIALSDAEVALQALGVSPLLIRPDSLVAYWPLIGRYDPEIDIVGGVNLTVTTAVAADHPRIYNPNALWSLGVPAVAAGGFIPYPNPRYGMMAGHQPMSGGMQ